MLLYAPGYIGEPAFAVVWIDRAGNIELLTETRANYFDARLSPDGKSLAFNLAANNSIWLYDLERATSTRLVAGFENMAPVWGPSGDRLAFTSNRSGGLWLHWQRIGGPEAPEQLLPGNEWQWPTSWSADSEPRLTKRVSTGGGDWPLGSPDGRELFYRVGAEVWVATVDTGNELELGAPRRPVRSYCGYRGAIRYQR